MRKSSVKVNKTRLVILILAFVGFLQGFNAVLLDGTWLISFLQQIPVLKFTIAWNKGIAFGAGNSTNLKWFFVFASLLICLFFFLFGAFVTKNETATLLVVSGGLSNMVDRLAHGAVLDFIGISGVNFPLFNLSDILISSGVVLFILKEMRGGNCEE